MSACLDCGGSECICRAGAIIADLTAACQIFTQALGSERGYIPNLGEPKTQQALALMKRAGVKPVFYWDANGLPSRSRSSHRSASTGDEPTNRTGEMK